MDSIQQFISSGGHIHIIPAQPDHWPKPKPKKKTHTPKKKPRPPHNLKQICRDCPERPECNHQCYWVRIYADQDYVGEHDHPFSWIPKCRPECIDETQNALTLLWPKSGHILTVQKLYFRHKMRINEIADFIYLSTRQVRRIVHQLKMKIRPKTAKSAHIYKVEVPSPSRGPSEANKGRSKRNTTKYNQQAPLQARSDQTGDQV